MEPNYKLITENFKKFIKEEDNSQKWQVIFHDYGGNETIIKQLFDSENEANKWGDDLEYDFQDIVIDDNGNDAWKTFYRFYNPETNESDYTGFDVIPYVNK